MSTAIDLARELYELDATAGDDTLQRIRANSYAVALAHRYWRKGNPEDLHESIRLSEETMIASQAASILREPKGTILQDPGEEVHTVNTLAGRLDERSELTGSLNDLDRSIDIMERLVAAVAGNWHKCRAEWLGYLASSLLRRYEQDERHCHSDLDRAVDLSREALELTENEL